MSVTDQDAVVQGARRRLAPARVVGRLRKPVLREAPLQQQQQQQQQQPQSQRADLAAAARAVLDAVRDRFLTAPADADAAMYDLQSGLLEVKSSCTPEQWEQIAAECVRHPVAELVWQDPFTRHSHVKPRGYAGDAQLLDYLYGLRDVPAGTTPLGDGVFRHMMQQQGALGVRARADVLARLIDETAEQFRSPRILSIACGHLREGTRSPALMNGQVEQFVALDQDADSLAEVDRVYAGTPVETVNCSVRAILAGKAPPFEGFHFVYAAGLYDYLSERVAQRLTRQMFDMLAPGGRMLVANFAPVLPEVAYMETFMGWNLIYRTPEEMARVAADVPDDAWRSNRLFWDESENVIFLDLVKRPARTTVTTVSPGVVAVPGASRVTFGPGVAPAESVASE